MKAKLEFFVIRFEVLSMAYKYLRIKSFKVQLIKTTYLYLGQQMVVRKKQECGRRPLKHIMILSLMVCTFVCNCI